MRGSWSLAGREPFAETPSRVGASGAGYRCSARRTRAEMPLPSLFNRLLRARGRSHRRPGTGARQASGEHLEEPYLVLCAKGLAGRAGIPEGSAVGFDVLAPFRRLPDWSSRPAGAGSSPVAASARRALLRGRSASTRSGSGTRRGWSSGGSCAR